MPRLPRVATAIAALLSTAPTSGQHVDGLEPADAAALIEFQPRIDAAIEKGVKWLLDHQQRDGSWQFKSSDFTTGQTALSAYTLMKSGLAPQHSAVQRAIANFKSRTPSMIYATGCQMLALAATHDTTHVDHVRGLLGHLLAVQDGSWTYPNPGHQHKHLHTDRDLSITQFALLGFRSAAQLGIRIPPKALREAFDHTLRYQDKPRATSKGEAAGFRYHWAERGPSTGSMTTAGIATASMAAECLGDKLDRKRERQLADANAAAIAWLDEHYTVDNNPQKDKSWYYYYLYGLERAGSMLGIEYIGKHPWYLDGARRLIEKQAADGSWTQDSAEADTCFALLFLKRATAPPTTGKAPKPSRFTIDASAKPDVGFQATGGLDGTPLRMWITDIRGISADDASRPSPNVASYEFYLDGERIGGQTFERTKPWPQTALLAECAIRARGKHAVVARVQLADAAAEAAAGETPGEVLSSQPFEFQVDHALEGWMLDAATAAHRSLLPTARPNVSGSSGGDANSPNHAVDGDPVTGWRFAAGDAEPTLTIALRKSLKASQLRLEQLNGQLVHVGHFDRIERVSISIDKLEPMIVELDPDELRPTIVNFGDDIRVKRIEIRVLSRQKGTNHPGIGGFAEVALEQR